MLKINSKQFNFNFFLSDRKKVESLETGAIANGGATKFDDNIYSNIQKSEYIRLTDDNNISIFIPSTMDVDKNTDNSEQTTYSINYLKRFYSMDNITFYKSQGSWYSEDLKKVVYDDITLINVNIKNATITDINIFINLANYIKKAMNQEGVSVSINNSLAII